MKLRSEFNAANASGSLWAEIAAHFCLRRSRRLNPALKPASRDLLALPPSVRCRKRKVGGVSSPLGDEEAQAKRARKEEEDGFPAPANSGVSGLTREGSEGDLTDAAESDSGQTGNGHIEDGILEELNKAASGEQEKEATPLSVPISEISTEEQGKKNAADPELEQAISGGEKGHVVSEEKHDEIRTISPSILEVLEAEKKDSRERVIAAEEEICVVNRSPTYSDASLDNHHNQSEDMEGTKNSSDEVAVDEEINELPPSPRPIFWVSEAEKDTEQVNFRDPFLTGPQFHFELDKGDTGRVNFGKSVLKVRDSPTVNYGGCGNGGRRTFRRTEIFAGEDYSRMEVVCLYESLSLPFG